MLSHAMCFCSLILEKEITLSPHLHSAYHDLNCRPSPLYLPATITSRVLRAELCWPHLLQRGWVAETPHANIYYENDVATTTTITTKCLVLRPGCVLINCEMLKFVHSHLNGLPEKRKQSQRACEACRKRKVSLDSAFQVFR